MWAKEIHSEVLNELFEDPDRVVNDVTKYFLKNIPLSYSKRLDEFGESNG